MKKALRTDLFREIRKSMSRYLSLLFIVALGVAFFAGIRSAEPDMQLSADRQYDSSNLMDIRVLGTLGVTDDDLEAILAVDGVESVEAIQSLEAFASSEEDEYILSVTTLTSVISTPQLTEGRLPESEDECVLDALLSDDYELGDTITLYGEEEGDLDDSLSLTTYTIVGFANSPYYLSWDRGTASIGDGTCDGILFLMPEVFTADYYSQILITVEGALELTAYTDEYQDLVDSMVSAIEEIADAQCELRYTSVLDEAEEALEEGRAELADAEAEADEELADAYQELTDAEAELADAKEQLADAEAELADGIAELEEAEAEVADGIAELEEAEAELADGEVELADGWAQYQEGMEELVASEAELESAKAELEEQEAEFLTQKAEFEEQAAVLADAWSQLEDGEAALAGAEAELTAQEAVLAAGWEEYEAGLAAWEEGWSQYEAGLAEYEAGVTELESLQAQLTQLEEALTAQGIDPSEDETYLALAQAIAEAEAQLTAAKAVLDASLAELTSTKEQLDAAAAELTAGEEEITAGWAEIKAQTTTLEATRATLTESQAQLDAAEEQITEGEAQIAAAWAEIEEAEAQLAEGQATLAESYQTLLAAQAEIEAGRTEIEEGWAEIEEAQAEIADGWAEIADAEAEIADAEIEIADGWEEYEDGKAEAEAEIADAEAEIADAEAEIADIEYPEWYVLDRNTVASYVEYGMNAERVGKIGQVFPAIFFLVAALVALTTMTRMVEEERTQIGTLKALGYSQAAIAAKYLIYALSASLIGSILGVLVGCTVLPQVIMMAYQIMYTTLEQRLSPIQPTQSIVSTLIAVCCVTIATWAACYRELRSSPAELMRPAAPKQGKRILLERVTFFWNRLNFSGKATLRNLIRYKKRFFMTIFGIGGCMGLLMVGFGLKDSIATIMDNQYTTIWTFDVTLGLDDDEDTAEAAAWAEEQDEVLDTLTVYEVSKEAESEADTLDIYLFVPETLDTLDEYVDLHSRTKSGETYTLTDDGVIITEKLARVLELDIGDSFEIKDSETESHTVTVTAIVENYLYHYVYMTPALYEEVYGETPEYNELLAHTVELDLTDEETLATALLSSDGISSITYTRDRQETVDNMMGALDLIMWVLIISAGLLAFVVLYNLNNINITERRRELATLKVLGFYDGEVAGYVYRENVLLTILGILLGIVIGIYLHRFVIETAEIDSFMFGRTIKPMSYVYCILLTILFSILVNGYMFFKLKKIDMIESLKSVE